MRKLLIVLISLFGLSSLSTVNAQSVPFAQPNWSPDGSAIYYISGADGRARVVPLDGLTPGDPLQPEGIIQGWLPDSSGVLVKRYDPPQERPGDEFFQYFFDDTTEPVVTNGTVHHAAIGGTGIAYTSTDNGDTSLNVASIGGMLPITLNIPDGYTIENLSWTPDADVLFARMVRYPNGLGEPAVYSLWAYNRLSNGGGMVYDPVLISENMTRISSWSPDNSQFIYYDGGRLIQPIGSDKGVPMVNLLSDDRLVNSISISNDGQRIVYSVFCESAGLSEGWNINPTITQDEFQQLDIMTYLIDRDEQLPNQIINRCEDTAWHQPRISPTGDRLLYSTFEDGVWQLVVKDLDSGDHTVISTIDAPPTDTTASNGETELIETPTPTPTDG